MGGLCCCKSSGDEEKIYEQEGKSLAKGPLTQRSCTDILCLICFLVHLLAFIIITFVGVADGDPRKLYRPRDYHGGYCGVADYGEYEKLMQTMNTTEMVDETMQQAVCSTASVNALDGLLSTSDYQDFLCSCCLVPCGNCTGSLGLPDVDTAAELKTTIAGSMARLTDLTDGSSLLGSSSSDCTSFSAESIFSEMTKYFISVCYSETCSVPDSFSARNYTYRPEPDSKFLIAWTTLLSSGPTDIQEALEANFVFSALPTSLCPYEPRYCVPMPGVNFTEAPNDYCIPKLETSVISALGTSAVAALEGLGSSAITEGATEGLGNLVGDMMNSFDATIIVAFWSFMMGLIFLVLLRFLVGCIIWGSLGLVFLLLAAAGGLAYIRSEQCEGASLFETGQQSAVAVTVAATAAATAALTGNSCVESLSGNGADYRGCQTRTVSGTLCQKWDVTSPHDHDYNSTNYPSDDLSSNYCRNPLNASTIWCITTNSDKTWEECSPIGVVTSTCTQGYEVDSQTGRDALKVCAVVVWVLAFIWILLCICLYSRIRLAIAINKVAAQFVAFHPSVLLIPIFQVFIAILYTIFWAFCASFLLSQVPDSYTSTEYYATYSEAMGTADTAGECNPKWPAGWAYKYSGDLSSTDDPCSGNMGDVSGITPKCWRCAPPRYVFDYYFAYTFFSFLWNNALFVATGQCMVAAAVGIWFFTKRDSKGKKSPVRKAVWIVFRYHMGSVAFGAFIIAVVQFIRYCMKYLEKQAAQQKNRVMVYVLKAVQCCIWCFEKCLKFLNKHAYIQIALLGTNFCTSAKAAFYLIWNNAARIGTMVILGSIIQFIGSTVIIVGTVVVGYFILQALYPSASPLMPMLLYLAIAYLTAQLFMNVFGLAVDTCLHGFIIAEKQNLDKDCVPPLLQNLIKNKGSTSSKKIQPVDDDAASPPGPKEASPPPPAEDSEKK